MTVQQFGTTNCTRRKKQNNRPQNEHEWHAEQEKTQTLGNEKRTAEQRDHQPLKNGVDDNYRGKIKTIKILRDNINDDFYAKANGCITPKQSYALAILRTLLSIIYSKMRHEIVGPQNDSEAQM